MSRESPGQGWERGCSGGAELSRPLAAKPGLPGLEHGPVGPGHQLRQRRAVAGLARRPAEGRRRPSAPTYSVVPGSARWASMRRVMVAQSGSLEVERQHEELGAADAGQDVALAEGDRQGARHGLERRVAGVESEALVQLLHVLDVGEEGLDRRRPRGRRTAAGGCRRRAGPGGSGSRSARRPGRARAGARSAPPSRARWRGAPRCRAGCCRIWTAPSASRNCRVVASMSTIRPSPRRSRSHADPATRSGPARRARAPSEGPRGRPGPPCRAGRSPRRRGRAGRRRPGWRR